jgi:hypothetical protein
MASPIRETDQTTIIRLLVQATLQPTGGSPSRRLHAALFWASVASKWADPSAIEAYRTSLQLLEMVLAGMRSLGARHLRLTSEEIAGSRILARNAAAFAIERGEVELALEMLEQGRGVLLMQAGRFRTPIQDLETVDSQLASEFQAISKQMEASVMESRPPAGNTFMTGVGDPVTM